MKPNGGLTREQVDKLLGELAEDRATHLRNSQRADANNERYFDHQKVLADGIERKKAAVRIDESVKDRIVTESVELGSYKQLALF